MITINNSIFDAQGADKKAKVYGITLNGAEDILIKDCEFKNQGYSSILNHCAGNVSVENCVFNCETVYNPIEGSQSVSNGNVEVKGCEFKGAPGNNFINFYQFKDGSKHVISNCKFSGNTGNNICRVSNRTNAVTEISFENCDYVYVAGTPDEYTGFLLCQDYTKGQDFTKVKVSIDNVTCNGKRIVDEPAVGSLFYVYDNEQGIITGQDNDPVVTIK